MKIYVAECYHDDACGIFGDQRRAILHYEECGICEGITAYELKDGVFIPTEQYTSAGWTVVSDFLVKRAEALR